MAEPIAILRWT